MTERDPRLDLTRPLLGGVYDVDASSFDTLAWQARRAELALYRIDLAGCADKADLLGRIGSALNLPADAGDNWDALADCLRDPGLRAAEATPAWGDVLLFAHCAALRRRSPRDFAILLGVLDDAATFAIEHDRPFFAFFALPGDATDAPPDAA